MATWNNNNSSFCLPLFFNEIASESFLSTAKILCRPNRYEILSLDLYSCVYLWELMSWQTAKRRLIKTWCPFYALEISVWFYFIASFITTNPIFSFAKLNECINHSMFIFYIKCIWCIFRNWQSLSTKFTLWLVTFIYLRYSPV